MPEGQEQDIEFKVETINVLNLDDDTFHFEYILSRKSSKGVSVVFNIACKSVKGKQQLVADDRLKMEAHIREENLNDRAFDELIKAITSHAKEKAENERGLYERCNS